MFAKIFCQNKPMPKSLLFFIGCILFGYTLESCKKTNSLIGTWEAIPRPSIDCTINSLSVKQQITFYSDNSFEFDDCILANIKPHQGSYMVQNDYIHLTPRYKNTFELTLQLINTDTLVLLQIFTKRPAALKLYTRQGILPK
ncbi:MAG: hypothetical protein GY810_14915 [Aureispira sp.]|nr:hypothetical protein [Aureispira sp.]